MIKVQIDDIAYKSHRASGTLEDYKSFLKNKIIRRKFPNAGYEISLLRKMLAHPGNLQVQEKFFAYNEYVEQVTSSVDQAFAQKERELYPYGV